LNGTGQRIQIIANRSAGRAREDRIAGVCDGFIRQGAEVVLTECGPDQPIVIAEGVSHVCVVGGDGTVRHVAAALATAGRDLPLSIYPGGTINLAHRELRSPVHPGRYAAYALGGENLRRHHAIRVGDALCLSCASVGPDSHAVATVSPRLKRRIGRLAYLVAFLRILVDWPRTSIRLHWEGGELACEAFYVAKGRFFAGPWSFAPEADRTRPVMHVVALRSATRRNVARFAWAVARGRCPAAAANLVAFSCTSLSAEADAALPVQVDGDPAATLPVRMAIDPISFSVC
jgi:diacylglycerol kinase family enzyme